jgi:hypothetical protein
MLRFLSRWSGANGTLAPWHAGIFENFASRHTRRSMLAILWVCVAVLAIFAPLTAFVAVEALRQHKAELLIVLGPLLVFDVHVALFLLRARGWLRRTARVANASPRPQ